ncbi:hypothetical protein GF359_01865, partial [candidate division WOR-3 bacterium]|nr:hypothetical protein [candidate division WOR-3 bacterium]MBD3363940.1 hypothetical protein [candidate division WOR-3 bacterium]
MNRKLIALLTALVLMAGCKSFKEGFEDGYYGESGRETKTTRKASQSFAGTYHIEGEGASYTGTLEIKKIKGVKDKAYSLEWT